MSKHGLFFSAFASLFLATIGCATPGAPPASPLERMENSMVFAPMKFPEGNWFPQNLSYEDVWFAAADGTKLHGWYLAHEKPRAVVLFAHGNAGNITHRADMLRRLHDEMKLTVLAFDYRGYGRSEGTPDEDGILQDARAARKWLAQKTGVAEKDIVLMGRSLGGGVAVDLAAKDGARALVLESTFTSLPDVAADLVPLAPSRWLMRNRLDSINKIGKYHGPLLQSHGDADKIIAYDLGKKLFAAANEPKRFVAIPGRDHNDPQTDEYYRELTAFLDKLPKVR